MPNTRQILIVDDDPELRDALSEQLSLYEEFKAFAAEDGRKGVQAAKAGQIDLVIMDVGLPDIDGHEAVRILLPLGFSSSFEPGRNACGPIVKTASSLFSCWRSWARMRASSTAKRKGLVI